MAVAIAPQSACLIEDPPKLERDGANLLRTPLFVNSSAPLQRRTVSNFMRKRARHRTPRSTQRLDTTPESRYTREGKDSPTQGFHMSKTLLAPLALCAGLLFSIPA